MRTKIAVLLFCGVAFVATAGFFLAPWTQRQVGMEFESRAAAASPPEPVRRTTPEDPAGVVQPGHGQAGSCAPVACEKPSLGAEKFHSYAEGLLHQRKDLRLRQTLVGGAAVEPAFENGSYAYPGVLLGVDAMVRLSGDRVQEFLRIAPHAAEHLTYRIAIEDGQHGFKLRDGFLDVVDLKNQPVLNLEESVYWEDGQEQTKKDAPLPVHIELSDARTAILQIRIPNSARDRAIMVAHEWSDANYAPGRLLVKFRSGADVNGALRQVGGDLDGGVPQIGVKFVCLPAEASERASARALGMRGDVEYSELDAKLPPMFIPNDPMYPNQWHHPNIGSPAAWNTTRGSNTVIVAVIDSGVDGKHPDLSANLVAGWNFYDGNSNTSDVTGHGTAVAGTIAALGNNGVGVSGVAPNCRIMPLRTTDGTGYSTASRVVSALTFAADNGARVVNASIGKMGTSYSVNNAAGYLRSKGGILCVAAGNEGADISSWSYSSNMIVVGATYQDVKTSWSNYGSVVDVVAPGDKIYSTNRGGTYGVYYGTSFASPIAASVVALIRSANPTLTPTQAESLLMSTAKDLDTAGRDNLYGNGRVDAAAAVAAAAGGQAIPPTITTQPFSQTVVAGQAATFSVAATGTAPLAYHWRKNGVNIAGATAASYRTPAATASDNGAIFSVVVSNVAGSVTSANATLFVNVLNVPPVSNAGPDQVIEPGTYSLIGSGSSDPDNGPSALTYAWSQVSGPATVGILNTTKALGNVTLSVLGDYVFRLTVSDGAASSSDTVKITVMDSTPPLVYMTSVVLKGSADGTGSGIASVTVNGAPAVVSGSTWQKEVSVSSGNNVLTVTVTDGSGQQASQTIQVTK